MGEARSAGDRPPAASGTHAPHPPTSEDPGLPVGETPTRPRTEEGSPRRAAGGGHRAKPSGPLSFFLELPGLILVAFVLALLIKTFLVQAFFIPSQSMEPTLQVGDRVLVNKFIFALREPRRGEVIVFENPRLEDPNRNPVSAFWRWVIEGLGVSANPEKDFIKRVIGLPGETIEVNRGQVFIDGQRIEEPYLGRETDRSDYGPFTIPGGHLFVMGDNRANSQDSRSPLGPVPRDKVVGEAFTVIWPPSHIEWLSDD